MALLSETPKWSAIWANILSLHNEVEFYLEQVKAATGEELAAYKRQIRRLNASIRSYEKQLQILEGSK